MRHSILRNNIKKVTELLALFITDIGAIFIIFELAVQIRRGLPLIFHESFPPQMPATSLDRLWWTLLVWCCFLWYEGLYTRVFSFWDEIKALLKVAVFSTAGVFTIVSIGKLGEE